MRRFFCAFLFAVFLVPAIIFFVPSSALSDAVSMHSSTQFSWGDDITGEGESTLSQYLRVRIVPDNKKYSFTGYGRIWKNLSGEGIRDDDISTRLYYFYMDYVPREDISVRLGRQFVNFSAGSSVMDGLSVDISGLGPVGVTFSGGMDVKYSLDSEHSRLGNYFAGIDVHLEKTAPLQLGVSYIRRYDEWDRAREEFGLNARYFIKMMSPYAEVRYDRLSETVDEAVVGIDIFPADNLMIKGEFYHSYPTFDSTSIYSVFAVDRYREYLIRAEYSFEAPVVLYVSYSRQNYDDSENADRYKLGSRYYPSRDLSVNASVDYRNGYGGSLWGFELYGNYRLRKSITLFAGAQYDRYRRPDPDESDYDNAQRYWVGGEWRLSDNTRLSARIEDNINENFDHRPLGRVALTWYM